MSEAQPLVDILLATYNGEAFLEEQLRSLEAQTWENWRVIARDDGSRDGTVDILEAFRERHPDRVVVLHDDDGNLGYVRNFERLLMASDAPYFAFCDQDDVWLVHKVELLVGLLDRRAPDLPQLAFSDLVLTDADGSTTHASMWRHLGLRVEALMSPRLLLQNCVTGCASVGNASLRALMLPFPDGVHLHDWWMALCAVSMGRATFQGEPSVRYRQHSANAAGAAPSLAAGIRTMVRSFRGGVFPLRLVQARCFGDRFKDKLPQPWVDGCRDAIEMASGSRWRRAVIANRMSTSKSRAAFVFLGIEAVGKEARVALVPGQGAA